MEKTQSGIEKNKKQSINNEKQSTLFESATKDELEVVEILLELNTLMSLTESLKKSNWVRTRRRSVLDAPPLSPSTSAQRTPHETQATVIKPQEINGGAAGQTTRSPDTPLAFPSSESELNPGCSSKTNSKKRSKEYYMDMIQELTQTRNVLKEELEKAQKHHKFLSAYNSQLKSLKLEMLNTSSNKDMNLGTQLAKPSPITMVPHHPPSIVDPTSQNLPNAFSPITAHLLPPSNIPRPVNHVGPSRIDFNIPAEVSRGVVPSQPLDSIRAEADQRARCAEARRNRIVKFKSMKLPRTK